MVTTRRSLVLAGAAVLLGSKADAQSSSGSVSEITLRLPDQDSPQAVTEFATLLRTIGDIREVLVVNEGRDVRVRGTASQSALSQWLFNEFQHSTPVMPGSERITHAFQMNEPSAPEVRTSFLEPAETPMSLTEYTTMLRTIMDVRRVFTYIPRTAMALRGTAEQAEAADWLLRASDPASKTPPLSLEYRLPAPDDVIKLFSRPKEAPARIQQISTQIRKEGQVRRLFLYPSHQIVAVRGNAEQIALASRLLQ